MQSFLWKNHGKSISNAVAAITDERYPRLRAIDSRILIVEGWLRCFDAFGEIGKLDAMNWGAKDRRELISRSRGEETKTKLFSFHIVPGKYDDPEDVPEAPESTTTLAVLLTLMFE